MSFGVYINFNGNCREAVEYYSKIFATEKPQIMTFNDVLPNPYLEIEEEDKHLILNASMKIKGTTVMFSDVPKGVPLNIGNNMSITITSKDMDEIKMLFDKLKEGGIVNMELQETFWSKCYGYVIDKFGICWQLSYEDDTLQY